MSLQFHSILAYALPAEVEGDRRGAREALREARAVSVERSVGADPARERVVPRGRRDARRGLPVAEGYSNGLRVLVRLGYAKDDANYAKTYRAAAEAVGPELPDGTAWLVAAHQLLRRHGQETCRRSEPRCKVCPLAKGCDFARES
jgi:hypothetical protein